MVGPRLELIHVTFGELVTLVQASFFVWPLCCTCRKVNNLWIKADCNGFIFMERLFYPKICSENVSGWPKKNTFNDNSRTPCLLTELKKKEKLSLFYYMDFILLYLKRCFFPDSRSFFLSWIKKHEYNTNTRTNSLR